jgi:hypothetical protein
VWGSVDGCVRVGVCGWVCGWVCVGVGVCGCGCVWVCVGVRVCACVDIFAFVCDIQSTLRLGINYVLDIGQPLGPSNLTLPRARTRAPWAIARRRGLYLHLLFQ